jgi:hypothetical protein
MLLGTSLYLILHRFFGEFVMRLRLTFFLEQADVGWSESIHTNQDPADQIGLISLIDAYMRTRMLMCTTETQMIDVRVSDDDTFRDIQLQVGGLPLPGAKDGPSAHPTTAMLVRMFTSNVTVQRSLFLRGLPLANVDGRNLVITPLFNLALSAYNNLLTSGKFVVNAKDRSLPKRLVANMDNFGHVTMIQPVTGAVPGKQVQVLGVKRSVIPQREPFVVLPFTSESDFFVSPHPPYAVPGPWYLRLVNFQTYLVKGTSEPRLTERRVGRPFGLPRGRAAKIR